MRKKIITSLLLLFLFLSIGALVAIRSLKNTTSDFNYLVEMHEVEELRKQLLISINSIRSDFITIDTKYAKDPAITKNKLIKLEDLAGQCSSCHHQPQLAERISNIQSMISEYKTMMELYMTMGLDTASTNTVKNALSADGDRLLALTEELTHAGSINLNTLSNNTWKKIDTATKILFITLTLSFFLGILVVVKLLKSLTRPVHELVKATRRISSGEYGIQIDYRDDTELGELAGNFNAMSIHIKEGYAKIQKEITERKQTEEALMQSEKFLTTIFDSIRDPFCILDRDHKIIKANNDYCSIANKKHADVIGEKCYQVLHNADVICKDCIVQKTFMSCDPCAQEKLMTFPNGSKAWIEAYTYPIFDEQGKISHVIEYARDISIRKRNELALRESMERYELAAKGANDGLWDWDLKTNKVYYSPRWRSMLGLDGVTSSDNINEWMSLIHTDDLLRVDTELSAHIQGLTPHFECEFQMLHRDGTYHWMLSRGVAVRRPSGEAYRIAGSMTDITERKLAEQQLVFDALHDALTGLPNRALFMDRLRNALYRMKRNPQYLFAVFFLDVDRFKVLNDSMGHAIGDKLLIAVSQRLEDSLRPGDTVARFGGDEFAIIIEDIKDKKQALQVAKRIQKKISMPFEIDNQEIFTSASIGITFSSMGYENSEYVLRDADIAMYYAKNNGNGRYEVFDKTMYANALARMKIETDLRQAIKQNELLLHYQPIVSIGTNRIIGLEALLRWQHPTRGLIYPSEFIDIAEETGLIMQLGEWVLQHACRQLRVWQQKFPSDEPLTMSVNISSRQLLPNLVMQVRQILNETKLQPYSLILEITESMFMENFESVSPLLSELKEMNVQLHIDDFGTGYSSLSYLHNLPIDVLKIDRSFVMKVGMNGENTEIIQAITNLAHSLNMKVIAEGVETEEQLRLIRSLNCEYIQGYLISRPLDSSSVETLLGQNLFRLISVLTRTGHSS